MSAGAALLGKLDKLAPALEKMLGSGKSSFTESINQLGKHIGGKSGSRVAGKNIQQIAGIMGSAGEIGGDIRSASSSSQDGFAGAAASGLRGAGAAAGQIGGLMGPWGMAIGKSTEYLAKFGAAIVELPGKIHDWGKQLHDANMQFANFSVSMAQVQAQTDVQRFYLKMEQGERRAATAQGLSSSMMNFERMVAPLEDWWTNVMNEFGTKALEFGTEMVKYLKTFVEWVRGEALPESSGEPPADQLGNMLETFAHEQENGKYGRPERMR